MNPLETTSVLIACDRCGKDIPDYEAHPVLVDGVRTEVCQACKEALRCRRCGAIRTHLANCALRAKEKQA